MPYGYLSTGDKMHETYTKDMQTGSRHYGPSQVRDLSELWGEVKAYSAVLTGSSSPFIGQRLNESLLMTDIPLIEEVSLDQHSPVYSPLPPVKGGLQTTSLLEISGSQA